MNKMPENELEIRLKVVDEASEPIKTSLNGIKGSTDALKQSGTSAGKGIQDEFRKAGKELREFRQSLFIVTAGIAAIIGMTREASKYNAEAKVTYDKFTTSIQALSATVGTALAPALEGVTALINILRDTIEAVIAGFIKMFTFITETFVGLWEGLKNMADNVKNMFTQDEDPVGIVEGFRKSFQRAIEISNIATDEFLKKVETTRARVESGLTIESEKKQTENAEKTKTKAIQDRAKVESDLKKQAVTDTKSMLAKMAEDNKAAAVAFQVISIIETIIATARGVAKALPNIPLAIAVGAIGAAQVALIASQKFAEGTDSVRKLATGTDTVPAMLTPGEMVVPRSFSDAIRQGSLTLGGPGGGAGGGGIQINIYGGQFDSRERIAQLAEEIGFEIEKRIGAGARSSL